jgi:hypothetical protein
MDIEHNDIINYKNHLEYKNIVIPLIYTLDENNVYDNIILIHDKINYPDQFSKYANSRSLSIIYNESSSNDELLELLTKNFINIKRIAIVFHNSNIDGLKEFTNNKPLFDFNDLEINTTEYSLNMQFIINLTNQFNVEHLDYLACNTLLYEHWNKYFNVLKEKTKAIIGASNDLTGNIKYGGDWVLENTNEDIKNIYFTEEVVNYQSTLAETPIGQAGGTITLNQNSSTFEITCTFSDGRSNQLITLNDWPVKFTNTSTTSTTLTIVFNTNIVFSSTYGSTNGYFIMGSNNITIDGNGKEVNIDNIGNYPGLFQNGTPSTTSSNPSKISITIGNLGVTVTGSSYLLFVPYGESGWICQGAFGQYAPTGNITINNCYSNGPIGFYSGGILGGWIGIRSSAIISANNCYSTGSSDFNSGGGIYGVSAGFESSATISANNCYSTGNHHNGGIFGNHFGIPSSAIISAYNCYTIGSSGIYGNGNYGISYYSIYVGGSSTFNPPITTQTANNWSDENAQLTINRYTAPAISYWTNTNSNTPWLLSIKVSQTISFPQIATKIYGDASFSLNATSTSGLTISYISSDTNVATISGSTVTIIGAGTCSITASQVGNTNYNAATDVVQQLTVNKAYQIISFPQIATIRYGDASFSLDATSTSGLTILYTSSDTNVATISGSTVTIIGAGTCSITASQAGDTNYNTATIVIQPLIVLKQSAKSLRDLGYSLNDLKLLKYTDYELLDAGFTMNDLIPEIYSGTDSLKKAIPVEADRAKRIESILKTQINTLGTTTTVFEQRILKKK